MADQALRPATIHGYADRLSVAPGETIEFKVSCDEPGDYRADLVRLIHGDTNPAGPGYKEQEIASAVNGTYPGRHQPIASGSHVIVDDEDGALALSGPFTLHAFVCPTTPGKDGQQILGRRSAESGAGYALTIEDGRLFGRGAMDFKGGLAAFTVAAMRLAREGMPRTRDLILLSEADEEGGAYGTTWLAENHWDKIRASESINEGGWIFAGGRGGARLMGITTIDKNSLSVTFRTRGTSTHSSRPLPDSALRRLVRALNRVEHYDTAPRITPTARTYLRAWARASSGATARRLRAIVRTRRAAERRRLADRLQRGPWGELYDGLVRNIFVPTIVGGGFRANVLPGTAEATVNMRMLPGQKPRPLIAELRRVVDDRRVEIEPIVTGDATVEETLDAFDKRAEQAPTTTDTDLYRTLVREGRRQWPGAEVTPALFEAGTDATPWRSRGIPVYGIYPYPISHGDLKAMHGNDERVPIRGLEQGTDMLTRVLQEAVG